MDITPRVTLAVGGFNKALGAMLESSKRSLKAVMEEQAKMFAKALISDTPPGARGKSQAQARKSGEKRIESNLKSIMRGVQARRAESTDIEGIHAANRTEKGVRRVPRDKRVKVSAPALKAYIQKVKGRVGLLASGWAVAAQKYGYKPPPWIARHAAQGTGEVSFKNGNLIRLVMINPMRAAHRYQWIVGRALGSRISAVWKREAKFRGTKAIEEAGRKAGLGK